MAQTEAPPRKQMRFEDLDVDFESSRVRAFDAISAISGLKIGTKVRVEVECEVVAVTHARDAKSQALERVHILKAIDGGTVVEEL